MTFTEEIITGLKAQPKHLPSKYFYDEKGDALFVKIMNAPEYYLTDAEYEIITQQSSDIIREFPDQGNGISLFELGAGDGTKTIELLKALQGKQVLYRPIDISENAICQLENRLKQELPELQFEGLQGEYFKVLKHLEGSGKKVILFLGSNLGNMTDEQAKSFMQQLADVLQDGDMVLLGLDLKKSSDIVLPAYDDAQGYTRDFNLNLLQRINREMNGDFDLDQFEHVAEYEEDNGIAKSYLESRSDQTVRLGSANTAVHFSKGERIFMEISRKYDLEVLNNILADTGLVVRKEFRDQRNYFCDFLLEKTSV